MDGFNDIKTAYFAGLIDGEGNIGIYNSTKTPRPIIAVKMTCEKTIDSLYEYFKPLGGCTYKRRQVKGYKKQYGWQVTHTQAIEVARLISPFVITKSTQISKILSFVPNKKGVAASRWCAATPYCPDCSKNLETPQSVPR